VTGGRTTRARIALLGALVALVALVACANRKPAKPAPTGAPCLTTTGAPTTGGGPDAIPDLSLPCFDGGAPVRLAGLGRPAVVNLWASWCQPCRAEMPEIERYASGAAGRVTVVGVDTGDTRTGGASVLADLGITYPNLYDQGQLLAHAIGRSALPATLFVDAGGRIRHIANGGSPLTVAALTDLVKRHLGVG